MVQILDMNDPSSVTLSALVASSPSASQWGFTMILGMNRNPDIQLNSNSTTTLFDNDMVREAMTRMLKHRVTRLFVSCSNVNGVVSGLQRPGCDGLFAQLRDPVIGNQVDHLSSSSMALHLDHGNMLQYRSRREALDNIPSTGSDLYSKDDTTTQRSSPQSPGSTSTAHPHHKHHWVILLESIDFLTLRQLTGSCTNFGNEELTALVDRYLKAVNDAKTTEQQHQQQKFLRRSDSSVLNFTSAEELAIRDLRIGEAHAGDGNKVEKKGMLRIIIRRNTRVTVAHLRAQQGRLSRNRT
ncbi:hypothetical protein BGX23_012733 [Mortierella sp. AD031]|nr:hypothetical protein BGX23_012733 [Mortierella sp. AD031]